MVDLWVPEKGEIIRVSNTPNFIVRSAQQHEFLGMFNGFFVCTGFNTKEGLPVFWRYAAQVIKENPWTEHNSKSWPNCDFDTLVTVQYREGGMDTGIASSFVWEEYGNATIINWRYSL